MIQGWTGISPASTEGRYLFACPKKMCFRYLTFKTLEEAQREEQNHNCPNIGGPTKVSWSVTKTLVQEMWEMLDEAVKEIFEPTEGEEMPVRGRIRARAIADCIVIFMKPYFENSDAVAAEAKRRYDAQKAGEEYETAGLGSRRYEPAVFVASKDGGYTTDPDRAGEARPRRVSTPRNQPTADNVDEPTKKAIKFALESGMFTVEELARSYKLSEAVIRAIENS